jgi:hypothetical protein
MRSAFGWILGIVCWQSVGHPNDCYWKCERARMHLSYRATGVGKILSAVTQRAQYEDCRRTSKGSTRRTKLQDVLMPIDFRLLFQRSASSVIYVWCSRKNTCKAPNESGMQPPYARYKIGITGGACHLRNCVTTKLLPCKIESWCMRSGNWKRWALI